MTSIVPTRRLCSAPSSSCGREILISVPGARVSIAENWSFTGNQLVGCSSSYIAQCAPAAAAAAVDRCLAFIRLYVHNCIPIFWRINREFPHAVTILHERNRFIADKIVGALCCLIRCGWCRTWVHQTEDKVFVDSARLDSLQSDHINLIETTDSL